MEERWGANDIEPLFTKEECPSLWFSHGIRQLGNLPVDLLTNAECAIRLDRCGDSDFPSFHRRRYS